MGSTLKYRLFNHFKPQSSVCIALICNILLGMIFLNIAAKSQTAQSGPSYRTRRYCIINSLQ